MTAKDWQSLYANIENHARKEGMMAGENLNDHDWLLKKMDEPNLPDSLKYEINCHLRVYRAQPRGTVEELREKYPLKPQRLEERT